jgi:hypothetical protein
MTEELGKIERPEAGSFKQGRKLYYVPLIFMPPEAAPGSVEGSGETFQKLFDRYWDEVAAHLKSLQGKLALAKKIYHELIAEEGEDALKLVERMNAGSFHIVKNAAENGGIVVAVEDAELLEEFMDWGRCLSIGLHSQKVFNLAYESYVKAQEKRNEYISKKVDSTLAENEAGIFIMREGHHVQFPTDIQVFYVSPPALDEIRRMERDLTEKPAAGETPEKK